MSPVDELLTQFLDGTEGLPLPARIIEVVDEALIGFQLSIPDGADIGSYLCGVWAGYLNHQGSDIAMLIGLVLCTRRHLGLDLITGQPDPAVAPRRVCPACAGCGCSICTTGWAP